MTRWRRSGRRRRDCRTPRSTAMIPGKVLPLRRPARFSGPVCRAQDGKTQKRSSPFGRHALEDRACHSGYSARKGFNLWRGGAGGWLAGRGAAGGAGLAAQLWIALAARPGSGRTDQADRRFRHRTAFTVGSRRRAFSRAESGYEGARIQARAVGKEKSPIGAKAFKILKISPTFIFTS